MPILRRPNRLWILVLLLPALACLFGSCANTRRITLMQGQFDTARLSQINVPEPLIQNGDQLNIIVYSDNPAATALYNQSVTGAPGGGAAAGAGSPAGTSGSSTPSTGGYLVDDSGYIQFQGLGPLHISGMTQSQLKDTLGAKLSVYLKNVYFTVRFLNYRFTVLGEINKPGVFNIPGARISLLEALGLAGDLTFYGRRDNVLFIRVNNGKREFARLDLTKPEIMASPYFYLQPNDVIIVEASKGRVAASDQVTYRNITIASAIVSTLAIIYSIFHK
ncbi:polysaccharide biosynthesis/export family protein [Puia dinghuensis]|uniref:Polysaccharide biosynthesis protein n=1 Tax=Puia dinghuensis TaxID=1792502 RepID=A0A8J2XSE9_9BACT|nr:polysaccharide biosynthesis/export family protein [Puia dinghuensis]GGB08674.1 polysaccharide biosynthesis protein [Puia dinghuensis]